MAQVSKAKPGEACIVACASLEGRVGNIPEQDLSYGHLPIIYQGGINDKSAAVATYLVLHPYLRQGVPCEIFIGGEMSSYFGLSLLALIKHRARLQLIGQEGSHTLVELAKKFGTLRYNEIWERGPVLTIDDGTCEILLRRAANLMRAFKAKTIIK